MILQPIELGDAFLAMIFLGPGRYSLDAFLFNPKSVAKIEKNGVGRRRDIFRYYLKVKDSETSSTLVRRRGASRRTNLEKTRRQEPELFVIG